jgi:hypothetical protein
LYQNILNDTSNYAFLSLLDDNLAAKVHKSRCPICGGKLHGARFPRKPRGVPEELEEAYSTRYSFCCSREGCRKRVTPPSFRFLSSRVYVGIVVVLISAMRHGATPKRVAQLRATVGVSRRTIERWRRWWRKDFIRSPFWRFARGRLVSPIDEQTLPLSLLDAFRRRTCGEKIIDLLRFILPLSSPPIFQKI